ncbi:hypothetical protein BL250_11885 [Erwinia sp. OLTSP20]|uniref:hypothetical protein n=1 Tax=unclassified Erwinia TaxID=2622719 RepID=UPI000C17C955|nr:MULTISPECIES: hypothetical protein [unclassified Erwinia]PIJ49603.1 hypothetical protein BV501_12095 [Erwinia sp. OAMSP11]PIJ71599.1 hypothetical protein BK416_11325 [Erwinia sp. OLSSP12]PIJ82669.1 hypothetical protein BLD47_06090 [Erwinia sp. OLCASP19]PIJ83136.1 hypothetical protein BLD46_10185 [Erwinia sp. OLMTSP26]PIJ85302.1 hypothetical protein BLD49_10745 [Erwinia sp. OLMDSP33]
MVNNKHLNEIIAIHSLISMSGIVPSLLNLQEKLIDITEDFCQSTGYDVKITDAIRRLISVVMDTEIRNSLACGNLKWNGYELTHFFYGHNEDKIFRTEHAGILFNKNKPEVAFCALRLITLCPTLSASKELQKIYIPLTEELNKKTHSLATHTQIKSIDQEPNISYEEIIEKYTFWTPFLAQLSVCALILIVLWACCRTFLQGGL